MLPAVMSSLLIRVMCMSCLRGQCMNVSETKRLLMSGQLGRGVLTGIGFSERTSGSQVDSVVVQPYQIKPKIWDMFLRPRSRHGGQTAAAVQVRLKSSKWPFLICMTNCVCSLNTISHNRHSIGVFLMLLWFLLILLATVFCFYLFIIIVVLFENIIFLLS